MMKLCFITSHTSIAVQVLSRDRTTKFDVLQSNTSIYFHCELSSAFIEGMSLMSMLTLVRAGVFRFIHLWNRQSNL